MKMEEADAAFVGAILKDVPGAPNCGWQPVPMTRDDGQAEGVADLEEKLAPFRDGFGWVVLTDGTYWLEDVAGTRDFGRLLHAELALPGRGVRVTLEAGETWRLAWITEDHGKPHLAGDIAYCTLKGKPDLRYRVYWDVVDGVYQQVAARLLPRKEWPNEGDAA